MTKREMFEAIVNGEVNAEVIAMAQAELVKLDKANARKSEKSRVSKAEADAPILSAIIEFLTKAMEVTDGIVLASEVANAVGVSTQKAQALLRKMCECEMIECLDVKVEKVGNRKGYRLISDNLSL